MIERRTGVEVELGRVNADAAGAQASRRRPEELKPVHEASQVLQRASTTSRSRRTAEGRKEWRSCRATGRPAATPARGCKSAGSRRSPATWRAGRRRTTPERARPRPGDRSPGRSIEPGEKARQRLRAAAETDPRRTRTEASSTTPAPGRCRRTRQSFRWKAGSSDPFRPVGEPGGTPVDGSEQMRHRQHGLGSQLRPAPERRDLPSAAAPARTPRPGRCADTRVREEQRRAA